MADPNDEISTDLSMLSIEPFRFLADIPVFSIRDGDPSDAVELVPGSTAARHRSIMKTADNLIMLLQTVDSILKPYKGGIDYHEFSQVVERMKKQGQVKDMKEDIEKLEDIMRRNSESAAYAYGFYCKMVELDMVEVCGRRYLTHVHSLKKFREGMNRGHFFLGIFGCDDYVANKRRQRMAGNDISRNAKETVI